MTLMLETHAADQPAEEVTAPADAIRHARIAIDRIDCEAQVRTQFEPKALRRLADSLIADGQLQPAIVFEVAGRFVVIAGGRRLMAARLANLSALDCIVFPHRPTPADATRLQLLENVLRQDLDPIEKANGFRLMMEQEGIQASQLADRLHLAKSTICRSLALLELQPDLQEEIRTGKLMTTLAREVARLPEEGQRRDVLRRIADEKLTATQAGRLVSQILTPRKAKSARKDRKTYKLSGYEAVVTPMRLFIAPTGAKKGGRSPDELVTALEQLLARLREDIASRSAPPTNAMAAPIQ